MEWLFWQVGGVGGGIRYEPCRETDNSNAANALMGSNLGPGTYIEISALRSSTGSEVLFGGLCGNGLPTLLVL